MAKKPKRKVLLVDDSQTVLLMHRMMLEDQYELVTARNGREGVAAAKANKPDVIFMDVVMPEMSGIEACRLIRQSDETAAIPVVMVTTRGEPVSIEEGYAAGCTDYVTKPFDSVELMAKLRSLLGEG